MSATHLENWRVIEILPGQPVLVGEVSGHPYADGWNTTSRLLAIAPDLATATTKSRTYILGAAIPADQPLPLPARRAVEAKLIEIRFGVGGIVMNQAALDEIAAVVARLAEAPGEPQ